MSFDELELDESIFNESWALLDSYDDNLVNLTTASTSINSDGSGSGKNDSKVDEKRRKLREKKREVSRRCRLKRKTEYEELKKRIKKMKDEQLEFMRTIEELETSARLYTVVGNDYETNSLVTKNNLLRQEVEEQREFVRKIHDMMVAAKTTGEDLQRHAERMEQLRLRRKCVELCEEVVVQGIGLVKDYLHNTSQVSKDSKRWVQTRFYFDNEGDSKLFCYEILPKGASFHNASRINAYSEHTFPIDPKIFDKVMVQNAHLVNAEYQGKLTFGVTKTKKLLYSDPGYYSTDSISTDPAVTLSYCSWKQANINIDAKAVIGSMFKRIYIAESAINASGSDSENVECVANVFTNLSSEFKGTTPLSTKYQFGARFAVPTKDNFTRVIQVDSAPLSKLLRNTMDINPDGSFHGKPNILVSTLPMLQIQMLVESYNKSGKV